MRKLTATLLVALCGTAAHAGPLDEAQACIDAEQFEPCLATIDKLEARLGRSPRLESMRAVSLEALGRNDAAYRSLLVYTELTRKLPLAGDASHQALLEMRDRLRADLEREKAARRSALDAERQQAAEAAVREAREGGAQQARTLQRSFQDAQRRVLTQAYAAAPDKATFEARMQAEGKDPKALRTELREAASSTLTQGKASLGQVLSRLAGKPLAFHPLPQAATDGLASVTLQKVAVNGNSIDYSAVGVDARGRELRENGTVQGLDLARLQRYSTRSESGRTVHVFEFDRPLVWRSGSARYADGGTFAGDLASSQGAREFRLQTPAEADAELEPLLRLLVDAARTGASLKP